MKKAILSLLLIVAVGVPVATIVSCSKKDSLNNIDKTSDKDIKKTFNSIEQIKMDKKRPTVSNIAVKYMRLVVNNMFKDAGKLKAADKWWDIERDSYDDTVFREVGETFYNRLPKSKDGYWGQLKLEDWVNVYDTPFMDMLDDPNHNYATSRPSNYSSGTRGYSSIYSSDPNSKKGSKRTGNNNNGLNGIYTGSTFWISGNHKKFIKSTAEYITGFELDVDDLSIENNWEHVSPASKEGIIFDGNRSYVYRSTLFPEAFGVSLGDLHNLRPSWGREFNQPRKNYNFGMVPGNEHKYGAIDWDLGESDFGLKVAEPRVNVRGDIARILFYMHDRYHINYDIGYFRQLLLWARMDPVTPEEISLDLKIAGVMGFSNDYVTGKKALPYDKRVDDMVNKANKDDSAAQFEWNSSTRNN